MVVTHMTTSTAISAVMEICLRFIIALIHGASVGDGCYSVQYVYTNPDGTVDVHTLRSVIFNPDGSYDTMGDLIGMTRTGCPFQASAPMPLSRGW